MPRPEKVQAVADIKERIDGSEAVFLTEYRGIGVQAMADLRRRLRQAGGDYKVVKMSLARLATEDLAIDGLHGHLAGPTGLAFANDPVAVAKALRDYGRDNQALVIKAGLLADALLAPDDISRLADIEPREVLLAKIAGAAQAPLSGLASMLGSFTRGAATMFSQLVDKKQETTAQEA